MNQKDIDEYWMRRALQLASQGYGHTSPNPMVGAVIVSADGRILGEGWHRKYGDWHAEVQAFLNVRREDEHEIPSATIYVTLEPCSHYGKTPPCAQLLVDKHIRRCVVGCGDPNPKVAGRGLRMLRKAGIEVTEDILHDECMWLNRRFMTAQTLRRPWIILKWAESADGFMAAVDDSAKPRDYPYMPVKLSTPLSSVLMHRERAGVDAILVGTNTILADRPQLTLRLWPGRNPIPVAFESPKLPGDITFAGTSPIWLDPGLSLQQNMQYLFENHGITSLMVEGGATMLQSFIDQNLYDEIRREKSALLLGRGLPAPEIK